MSDEHIEWSGYVAHLGADDGPQADDEVRLVLSADDRADECWTVKLDVFGEPEELERGTLVEVTASEDGVEFRRRLFG